MTSPASSPMHLDTDFTNHFIPGFPAESPMPENSNAQDVYDNSAVKYQLSSMDTDMTSSDTSRVLVIYTGGTIGMKNTSNGYVPVPNFLAQTLASMSRFHDPDGLSAFSLQSRSNSETDLRSIVTADENVHVQVPHKGGDMGLNKVRLGSFSDKSDKRDIKKIPSLITPVSLYGKRVRYSILEYDPLLDSVNMTMSDWIRIVTDIEENYQFYDAFLILHGTDTMAYTASALSFMLEELGKTVIITGSQVPITEVRNDAVENLLGALTIAGHFVIPEVSLYFGQKLFRGNRTSKVSVVDFEAFDSPNLRPLVEVGINIEVSWQDILRPDSIATFRAHKSMNPNVATLRLFPGITGSTIRAFLAPPVQGVVLETYGAGNAPSTRKDLIEALQEATNRGVIIVNCTQCLKGVVSDLYATGKQLTMVGVIPGYDMTPECALTKLSYLLTKSESPQEIRSMMMRNIRGELTIPSARQHFTFNNRTHTLIQTIVTAASAQVQRQADGSGTSDVVSMSTSVQERVLAERTLYPVLLCSACGTNDMEGLLLLWDHFGESINLNCVDYDGRTPLHIASSQGYDTIVEFLLLHGASIHIRDRQGHTPLFESVRCGNSTVLKLLKKCGAHYAEAELAEVGESWLVSVRNADLARIKLFVESGVDVNYRGIGGFSAIHVAIMEGKPEVLKMLVPIKEIDWAAVDQWGRSAKDLGEIFLDGLDKNVNGKDVLECLVILKALGA